jgi:hypothetical protein
VLPNKRISGGSRNDTLPSTLPMPGLPIEIYDAILAHVSHVDLLCNVALASKHLQKVAYRSILAYERDRHHPHGLVINPENRSSVLTVLRTALHPIDLPLLQYPFSYLKSDSRLRNEIIQLRGALRKRVEMGDRVGELVLEVSRVHSALFMGGTLDDEERQSQNHSQAMTAFQELFDDATRLCSTLTICCSSWEDSSSSSTTILLTQPDGQVSRIQGPKSTIAYIRSLVAQCFPQLNLAHSNVDQSIPLQPSALPRLSKAYPTVTNTLKIQSSVMLLQPPLLAWTASLLQSASVHTLAIHDTDVMRGAWSMLKLPLGANIREVVIQGCDIAFQDLCILLQRCTDTLCSVIAIPSSPPSSRPNNVARLSLPKVTFLRLPSLWLDELFMSSVHTFSQDLTMAGRYHFEFLTSGRV